MYIRSVRTSAAVCSTYIHMCAQREEKKNFIGKLRTFTIVHTVTCTEFRVRSELSL